MGNAERLFGQVRCDYLRCSPASCPAAFALFYSPSTVSQLSSSTICLHLLLRFTIDCEQPFGLGYRTGEFSFLSLCLLLVLFAGIDGTNWRP